MGVRLLLVALSGKVSSTRYYSLAELGQGNAVTWQSKVSYGFRVSRACVSGRRC